MCRFVCKPPNTTAVTPSPHNKIRTYVHRPRNEPPHQDPPVTPIARSEKKGTSETSRERGPRSHVPPCTCISIFTPISIAKLFISNILCTYCVSKSNKGKKFFWLNCIGRRRPPLNGLKKPPMKRSDMPTRRALCDLCCICGWSLPSLLWDWQAVLLCGEPHIAGFCRVGRYAPSPFEKPSQRFYIQITIVYQPGISRSG
jgi:hypothetical protein